ncbi:GDP-mannose 4,6-dehydratase [Gammaproteobacteria bacterium]
MKKALICGVTGQDGSYLAQFLLAKGYQVWGTSRDAQTSSLTGLKTLGIEGRVLMLSMAPNDFRSVLTALEMSDPDEIYFLSGQSSVGLSFEQPAETLDSIVTGILNLLEVLRLRKKQARLYNASSSECFGDTGITPANVFTPFRPRSPYAVAKASAHWLVANYREAYCLFACNGILFNHESPLRPHRFVTQKIVHAAYRIAKNDNEHLILGRLDISRDWGWAPEYAVAMWLMLQQDRPSDFIVATGETNRLEDFVATAFGYFGLDWRTHVETSLALHRPDDVLYSKADPSATLAALGWQARYRMHDVIAMMCEAVIKDNSLNGYLTFRH